MEQIQESLKEGIKRLALRNLEKEPILIHEKQKLSEMHEEIRQLKETYDRVRGQYGK